MSRSFLDLRTVFWTVPSCGGQWDGVCKILIKVCGSRSWLDCASIGVEIVVLRNYVRNVTIPSVMCERSVIWPVPWCGDRDIVIVDFDEATRSFSAAQDRRYPSMKPVHALIEVKPVWLWRCNSIFLAADIFNLFCWWICINLAIENFSSAGFASERWCGTPLVCNGWSTAFKAQFAN